MCAFTIRPDAGQALRYNKWARHCVTFPLVVSGEIVSGEEMQVGVVDYLAAIRNGKKAMKLGAARVIAGLALLMILSMTAAAQVTPPPKSQPEKSEAQQELAPLTSKTVEEAAAAAKAPLDSARLPTAAPVDPNTYVIGPEDILAIRVWREPELSQGVQVRPDGMITLPLVGELKAAGLTPSGLQKKVVDALSEFINKPEVTVSLNSVQSKKYYIVGEVSRPGTFPLVVPITVLQALTNAGGFREFADTKKITILRNGKVIKFNYKDVVKGKNMDQNILVENGDYIVVP
jgi:polysaccharide export outer membrane protein